MTMIALLPGDGIGSEVIEGPVEFLGRLAASGVPVTLTGPWPYGTTGWVETGSILPEETLEACRAADVILSGAVGAHPGIAAGECPTPEAALIGLRHLFDLRVSIRTVWVPGQDDVTIVRNITGGAYGGSDQRQESDGVRDAVDTMSLSPGKIREVVEIAAGLAAQQPLRRHVSVDKASVYATSRLWRRVASAVVADTGVPFEHVNVDRAAYELVKLAELPGVIATEGIFGDILSDIVCARAGSPALCGSATVNPDRPFGEGVTGLFEPAHGSSPHRTGSRRSNPTGAWLGLAALFDWCPDLAERGLAQAVRSALDIIHASGRRTYDTAGDGVADLDLDGFNSAMLDLLPIPRPPSVVTTPATAEEEVSP